MAVAVIIPAAGSSTRFGGPVKKTFATLAGRPVWQRTAEQFWSRPDVAQVYLAIAPADRDEFRARFGHLLLFVNAEVVDGGSERFESVANALSLVPDAIQYVAIHDAVRPLIGPGSIDAVFAAANIHGAAMLGMPLADTLKRVDASGRIIETVPRAGLWQAQTPQVFRRDWLQMAYARRGDFAAEITDDAQLVEATGRRVVVVPGSVMNFKITTRDDFEMAEMVVKSREAGQAPIATRPFDDEVV